MPTHFVLALSGRNRVRWQRCSHLSAPLQQIRLEQTAQRLQPGRCVDRARRCPFVVNVGRRRAHPALLHIARGRLHFGQFAFDIVEMLTIVAAPFGQQLVAFRLDGFVGQRRGSGAAGSICVAITRTISGGGLLTIGDGPIVPVRGGCAAIAR